MGLSRVFDTINKSIRWRSSIKKADLKNFAIFPGKHLCWSLFLIKLHLLQYIAPKTPILKNIRERLLLGNPQTIDG